ncbi:KRAB-A domain-containing 2-like [Brachionus plicatilis]|uniref:KRAB-A domain-containing 2-like n=1 Tax=Brachionus plicatilis TaxID=10195 RepID=A0A3M7QDW3_BRAPC|nr:KRAB-A domain-containing 2-like [Brachionus plicatilis]
MDSISESIRVHKSSFSAVIDKVIENSRKVYTRQNLEQKIKSLLEAKFSRFPVHARWRSEMFKIVALRLVDIFTIFGASYILQMDNGREFVAEVIKELKKNIHEQEPEKVFDKIVRKRRGPKRKVGLEDKEDAEEVEVVDPTTKISRIEKNAINIAQIESTCSENLKQNAEKMAQQHVHKLGEAKVGDTVQVPVPDVDRGPADLLNILAYITKINSKNMTYQLATKYGIIAG